MQQWIFCVIIWHHMMSHIPPKKYLFTILWMEEILRVETHPKFYHLSTGGFRNHPLHHLNQESRRPFHLAQEMCASWRVKQWNAQNWWPQLWQVTFWSNRSEGCGKTWKTMGKNGKRGMLGHPSIHCRLLWFLCWCSMFNLYLWCFMWWGLWDNFAPNFHVIVWFE